MKKIATLLFIMIFSTIAAQENPKMERIKTLRIAFISEKLDLTTDEAQKFWPVYNEYENKQVLVRKQKRVIMQKLKRKDSNAISDNDMNQMLVDSENLESEIQNNRKQFVKNLKGILPVKKILLLRQSEDEFKRKMLNQISKRRAGRRQE